MEGNRFVFGDCEQISDDIDFDEWIHAVLTYDHGYREVYINCDLKCTSAADYFAFNNANSLLGSSQVNTGFQGLLDDMIFFDRVLTHEEIEVLHGGNCVVTPVAERTIDLELVHVFPNPVAGILNYSPTEDLEISWIKIFDVQGQLLKVIPNPLQKTIDTGFLRSGTYFLTFFCKSKYFYQ